MSQERVGQARPRPCPPVRRFALKGASSTARSCPPSYAPPVAASRGGIKRATVSRGILALSLVTAAVLGAGSSASAAVDLTYRDCITGETETGPAPNGSGACARAVITGSAGASSGLDRLRSDAVSPDGRSLYTTSVFDDAVARFNRDPTSGQVTYEGCIVRHMPPPRGNPAGPARAPKYRAPPRAAQTPGSTSCARWS